MRNILIILSLLVMVVSNAGAEESYDDEPLDGDLSNQPFIDENGMITQQLAPPGERQYQVYPRKNRHPNKHRHDDRNTHSESVLGAENTPNIPGAVNAPNIPGAGNISTSTRR